MKPLPFPLNILVDIPAGLIAGLGGYLVPLGVLGLALIAGSHVYGFLFDRLAPEADPRRLNWVALGAGIFAGLYVAMVLYRALQAVGFAAFR